MRWFLILVIGVIFGGDMHSQTCCSGGVPVSSNLGLPQSEKGTWQISLNYDLNVLKTLKTGEETLEDRNRNRTTHTALFEVGHTFSRRLSIDGLFSYIRQERTVNNFGTDQFTATNGIGDVTFLLKYLTIDRSSIQLHTGIGIKAPTGASDKTNTDGITLNADLQPGSGAWDGIGWVYLSVPIKSRPTSALYANAIYARKGHNTSYLGTQDYKFGDEWQLIAGIGDQRMLFEQIFDLNVALRYRRAQPDENDDQFVPSTGGSWIFINPGISWWTTPNFSMQTNVELPLFANITGTQVTPTYRINAGFYYKIPSSKIDIDL